MITVEEDLKEKEYSNEEIESNSQENETEQNNQENKSGKNSKKRTKKIIFLIIALIFFIIIALFAIIYFTQIPIINYKGEEQEIVHYGEVYIDKGIEAYTQFKSIDDEIITIGEVDTSKIGKYTITYKVPYLNDYKTYERTVSVIDDEAPKITLNGDDNFNLSYGTDYQEPGYTAIDNCDGDISEKISISRIDIDENNYEQHYTVTDSSGNTSERIRYVKIVDDTIPKLSLNGSSVVSVITGNSYEEKGATALDNKDGDISSNIKISGQVDTSKEGTYAVTYEVSDSSGNVAKMQRKVIVNGMEKAGVIYLTFDDGPSTSITPQILDVLKEKGVHATFFILNYTDSTEYLVKRELQEGHAIGIHGYSHNYADIYTSVETCYENITKLQEKIYNTTGTLVKIVRFPGGSSNTISRNYCAGVMSEISKKILAEGFKYYDWNVASGDSGEVHTKEAVYANVTSGLRKGRNNVVLMHDFSGNNKTLEALPEIIDYGLENGYVFDIITIDTPMVTHNIQN